MGLDFSPASGQRKLADTIAPLWQVFDAAWPIPTLARRALEHEKRCRSVGPTLRKPRPKAWVTMRRAPESPEGAR